MVTVVIAVRLHADEHRCMALLNGFGQEFLDLSLAAEAAACFLAKGL